MSKTATIILIMVAALVFMGVGFAVGQIVQAAINTPGSADDPLVTQSYVDTTVGQRIAQMQTTMDELEAKVIALGGGSVTTTAPPVTSAPTTPTSVPTAPTTAPPSTQKVVVTGSTVNVRADAGTTFERIGSVAQGDKLDYLDTKTTADGVWYKVKLSDGKEGWVAGHLVKLE